MQYEVARTTNEYFLTRADSPQDALDTAWTKREEATSVRLTVNCVGEGELLTETKHPKFPDHTVEVTDEMLFIRAKNGDVVFSARLVQEDSTHDLEL